MKEAKFRLIILILVFLVVPKYVFSSNCETGSYESSETYGSYCSNHYPGELCKDTHTQSTAYSGGTGFSWGVDFWQDCSSDKASGTDYCISGNKKLLREYYVDCDWCDEVFHQDILCQRGEECNNGRCISCVIDNDNDKFCDDFEDKCNGNYGTCSGCQAPSCSECKEPICPEYPNTNTPYCTNSASSRQCGTDYYEYGCFWGNGLGSPIGKRYHDSRCNGNGGCSDYPADTPQVVTNCDNNQYCYCTGNKQSDCSCKPVGCVPTTEVCNGKDDDCDNQTDEELTEDISCGSGTCQGSKTRTCTNGAWSSYTQCSTNGVSCGTKDCDYLDTECRDYADKTKYCSEGNCQEPSCTAYVNKPSTTQCSTDFYEYSCPWGNNLDSDTGKRLHDNHCDGQGTCLDYPQSWIVDEYCSSNEKCYWDSLAQGDDNYYCKTNVTCMDNDYDNYKAISSNCPLGNDCNDNDNTIYPNAQELCDNKDNDCDIQIDENLVSSCPKQSGVCQGTTKTCTNGQWSNCNYGQYFEDTEITCDNKDNDCDGSIDESSVVCPSGKVCINGNCITSNLIVIRTFSKYIVQTNEVIDVYYNGSENTWSLKEKLPNGWTWISSVSLSPDGYLRDFITSYNKFYQIKAPINEGTYDFNLGEYCIGSNCIWNYFTTEQIKVGCNTPADSDCNGCISDNEFPIAVSKWKLQQGGITDEIFPQIVTKWKNQEGC